jgi:hypothetical protein
MGWSTPIGSGARLLSQGWHGKWLNGCAALKSWSTKAIPKSMNTRRYFPDEIVAIAR